MTTFDLEIIQVQLKNHTKSHESKLRISDPEWYRIYVQMSGPQRCCCCHCHLRVTCHCRCPCVTCYCRHCRTRITVVAHTSLTAAVIVAHALPSLPSLSHMRRHCCHCCHCHLQVLVGGSPLLSSSLLLLLLLSALPPSPCGVILSSPKCAHLGLKRHTM